MKKRVDIKFWIGLGISLFFMALLLRKIDFHLLAAALAKVNYSFILLAVLFTFISYFLRAVRWRFLLIHEKLVPLSSLYSATIIGYMANNLLPARLGEFVRAYILARREGLNGSAVFASLVIDRLFDGFSVLLMLLLTLFTIQLPKGMEDAGTAVRAGGVVMFLLYAGVILLLFLLKLRPAITLQFVGRILKPLPQAISERVISLLSSFISGIKLSVKVAHIAALVLLSLSVWIFCVLPLDFVLQGFGIHLPITASMFIMVLLVFAVMVPASPGFIGTYHYACFKGLSVFGIPETTSVSISLIIHGTSFFPVIAAGFYHLWKEGLSFHSLEDMTRKKNDEIS